MQNPTRTTAARIAALALAGFAGAARGGSSSRVDVSAVVVHSVRLQVAPRQVALASVATTPAGAASRVRAVAAPGGTFYVVGFDVGMNGASAPAALGLHVRGEGAAPAAADIRYHEGRGGAWNRARYGVTVPSGAQADLQVGRAHTDGGEVGVFVAKGAQAAQVDVVVTVLADAAPAGVAAVRP